MKPYPEAATAWSPSVQALPHHDRKRLKLVRLGQEAHLSFRPRAGAGHFEAVAARDDDLQIVVYSPKAFRQFQAVDAFGHHFVGEQQLDPAGTLVPSLQSLHSVGRLQHSVTEALQTHHGHASNRFRSEEHTSE